MKYFWLLLEFNVTPPPPFFSPSVYRLYTHDVHWSDRWVTSVVLHLPWACAGGDVVQVVSLARSSSLSRRLCIACAVTIPSIDPRRFPQSDPPPTLHPHAWSLGGFSSHSNYFLHISFSLLFSMGSGDLLGDFDSAAFLFIMIEI